VYTRNRNFRILDSSKLGKGIPLVKAATNEYPSNDPKRFFFHSLVTYIDRSEPLPRILTCSDAPKLKTSPYASPKKPLQIYSYNQRLNDEKGENEPSIYPQLDQYLTEILKTWGHPHCFIYGSGKIRNWQWFPDTQVLSFNITGNRFCERILREHKSNHIYIVVDLLTMKWCQRCHDPECKTLNFRSKLYDLPLEIENLITTMRGERIREAIAKSEEILDETSLLNMMEEFDKSHG
jgi:hypothetical protein